MDEVQKMNRVQLKEGSVSMAL
ncbi:tetracycline resistance efflux system leader peptide [Bacillus amyloliquefaciens]|nr:tetracycline resistance efflux system leader peptide [Bacillus amyloliquefaciens]